MIKYNIIKSKSVSTVPKIPAPTNTLNISKIEKECSVERPTKRMKYNNDNNIVDINNTKLIEPETTTTTTTTTGVGIKNNLCQEPNCVNIIKNKKYVLCEKHYRQYRLFKINMESPCIYSIECKRQVRRRKMCYLHYEMYLSDKKQNAKKIDLNQSINI
jgi:hypothetical protein